MIYLDYAAHTAPDEILFDILKDFSKKYIASANSNYNIGEYTKNVYNEICKDIIKLTNMNNFELILTSSATEANNLAIKGACDIYKSFGKHILLSPIEHSSVDGCMNTLKMSGFDIEYLSLTNEGLIDIKDLQNKLRTDTIMVSICSVNSETGIIQNIKEISNILKDYPNAIFHTDATQGFGKIDIDYSNCNLVSATAHKLFGFTSGCGVLFREKRTLLKTQLDGGLSVTKFRSSTPDIIMLKALSISLNNAFLHINSNYEYVKNLYSNLIEFFNTFNDITINSINNPYILNISTALSGEKLKDALANNNIYVSTKSACVAKTTIPKTIFEIYKDKTRAKNSIRISLSWKTTIDEIENFKKIFTKIYGELKCVK